MTVYVLFECVACEGDQLVGVFASLASAQAARPGPWRQLGAPHAIGDRWTTRAEGVNPWGGEWYAIEPRVVGQ